MASTRDYVQQAGGHYAHADRLTQLEYSPGVPTDAMVRMRALRRLVSGPLAILAVLAAAASPAAAKPPHAGSLDRSFGERGRVLLDLPGERMRPRAMLVQPDGRIVVAGYITDSPSLFDSGAFYGRALAIRLMPDGSLDRSFGAGGVARIQVGSPVAITGVGIQPDGSLLLAGIAHDEPGRDLGAVVRLRPDGAVDTGFGTGGLATVEPENITTLASVNALPRVVVHPDGRILVAGYQRAYDVHDAVDPFMARLLANGAPDPTFDENGAARAGPQRPAAIAPQPDGDLVVLGTNDYFFGHGAFSAYRVTPGVNRFPVAQLPAPDMARAYEWKRPVTAAAVQAQPDGGVLFTGGVTGRIRHYVAWVQIGPDLELLERGKAPAPDPIRGGTFDPRGALITTSGIPPHRSLGVLRLRGRRFHHDRSFGARAGVAFLETSDRGEFMGMAMQDADSVVVAIYTRSSDPAEDEPLTLYRLHARQDGSGPIFRLTRFRPRACLDSTRRVLIRTRDESRVLIRIAIDGREVRKTRKRRTAITLDPAKLDPGRHLLTVSGTDAAGNLGRSGLTFRVCANA